MIYLKMGVFLQPEYAMISTQAVIGCAIFFSLSNDIALRMKNEVSDNKGANRPILEMLI